MPTAIKSVPQETQLRVSQGKYANCLCDYMAQALNEVGLNKFTCQAYSYLIHNAVEEHLERTGNLPKIDRKLISNAIGIIYGYYAPRHTEFYEESLRILPEEDRLLADKIAKTYGEMMDIHLRLWEGKGLPEDLGRLKQFKEFWMCPPDIEDILTQLEFEAR